MDAATRSGWECVRGSETCVGTDVGEGEEYGTESAGGGEVDIALPSGYRLLEDDDRSRMTGLRVAVEIDTINYTAADVLCEGGESWLAREACEDQFAACRVRIGGRKELCAI